MLNAHEIGTTKPLNETADVIVTALQTTDGEALIGSVARGGCMVVGEMACKTTCQLWALEHGTADEEIVELVEADIIDPETILDEDPHACPDQNLANAFKKLEVNPARALMVAVGVNKTANRVGYLDDPEVQAKIVTHPRGWSEITPATPYNAIYVHENDKLPNGEPVELMGMRIAGNGLVVDDLLNEDGHAYGMTHLTRTNMPGRGHEADYDGEKQTYRNYVIQDSLTHYDADPTDITTHIISAVSSETAQVRFPDRNLLESVMPGWADDGLIKNISNPQWQPGMDVVNPITGDYDLLQRDYPEQIRRQVHEAADKLGITKIREESVLDPGNTDGELVHSSADRVRNSESKEDGSFIGSVADRDLYAVIIQRKEH